MAAPSTHPPPAHAVARPVVAGVGVAVSGTKQVDVGSGVRVGEGVGVGTEVAVRVGGGVGVPVGITVGVGAAVGVGVGEAMAVSPRTVPPESSVEASAERVGGTVGVAMGARGTAASSEASGVVLLVDALEPLAKAVVIAKRTRRIALQSVLVGLGLSIAAMIAAAFGYLPPIQGALFQEIIDVAVILNALRALR